MLRTSDGFQHLFSEKLSMRYTSEYVQVFSKCLGHSQIVQIYVSTDMFKAIPNKQVQEDTVLRTYNVFFHKTFFQHTLRESTLYIYIIMII